jgi:hypothetical protein
MNMVPEFVRQYPELRKFCDKHGGKPLPTWLGTRDAVHRGDISFSYILPTGATFRSEFLQGAFAMVQPPDDPVSLASSKKEYRSLSVLYARQIRDDIIKHCPKPEYLQEDRFNPLEHYDEDDLGPIPASIGPDGRGYYNRQLFFEHLAAIIASREELLARAAMDLRNVCPQHMNSIL